MTIWVLRNGELVEKNDLFGGRKQKQSMFPTPMLSRFEAIESPVTGKQITSWRERDRDMAAAGAVDPRDLPRKPFEERKKRYGRSDPTNDTGFQWRRPTEADVTPRGRRSGV
jgi:hypothetical protein